MTNDLSRVPQSALDSIVVDPKSNKAARDRVALKTPHHHHPPQVFDLGNKFQMGRAYTKCVVTQVIPLQSLRGASDEKVMGTAGTIVPPKRAVFCFVLRTRPFPAWASLWQKRGNRTPLINLSPKARAVILSPCTQFQGAPLIDALIVQIAKGMAVGRAGAVLNRALRLGGSGIYSYWHRSLLSVSTGRAVDAVPSSPFYHRTFQWQT